MGVHRLGSMRRGQSCPMPDTDGCSQHPADDHGAQLSPQPWGQHRWESKILHTGVSEENRSVRNNPVTLRWEKKGERCFRHHSRNFLCSPWKGPGMEQFSTLQPVEGSMPEQVAMSGRNCSPWRTSAEEGLSWGPATHPEGPHSICSGRTADRAEIQHWSRENCEEEETAEWNSYGLTTTPLCILLCCSQQGGGRGAENEGMKLSLWKKDRMRESVLVPIFVSHHSVPVLIDNILN